MFGQIPQITPEEAKTKASNGNFVIIDVREHDEVRYTNLSKINVPYTHIRMGEIVQKMNDLPRDKQIGVMCHTGSRSARVTMFLRQKGYDAVNIQGGIEYWARSIDPALPRY